MHLSTFIKLTVGKMKSVPHSDGPTQNNHTDSAVPRSIKRFFDCLGGKLISLSTLILGATCTLEV